MVRVAFLLCCVALATAEFGFRSKQQYEYIYQGKIMAGLPGLQSQWSGLGFKAHVHIQAVTDQRLIIKLTNPEEGEAVNKYLDHSWREDFMVDWSPVHNYKTFLEEPFVVEMQGGKVAKIEVDQQEPETVVNMKKALVALLQVNLHQGQSFHQGLDNALSRQSEEDVFTVREDGIGGYCETIYEISSLPQWLQMSGIGELSPISKNASSSRYQITKTKNYENCHRPQVYTAVVPYSIQCQPGYLSCESTATNRSAITHYIITGDRSDFRIESIMSEGESLIDPLGQRTEKLWSVSNQTLQLIRELPFSSPFPGPRSPRALSSLTYIYPLDTSSESHRPQEGGHIPMPSLTSPPPVPVAYPGAPMDLVRQQVTQNVLSQKVMSIMRVIQQEFFEKNEASRDVTMYLMQLQKALSLMSYTQIREIYREISQRGFRDNETLTTMFAESLAMTGTNPALMVLKDLLVARTFSTARAVQLVAVLPMHIKTPTPELLEKIMEMISSSSFQQKNTLKVNSVLAFSNILYQACIDPEVSFQSYPEQLYGRFCSSQTPLVNRFIHYVSRLLETSQDAEKPAYLQALGNLAHEQSLVTMQPYITGQRTKSPHVRSAAILALNHLAKLRPHYVQKLVAAVFHDKAEDEQVRMAAFAALVWSNPPLSSLQKLAISTWAEPSEQVVSFVHSSLYFLANNTAPQMPTLFDLAKKAQVVLPLVRPPPKGVNYAKNIIVATVIDSQQLGAAFEAAYLGNPKSMIPTTIYGALYHYFNGFSYSHVKFNLFLNGLQKIVDKITKPQYMAMDSITSRLVGSSSSPSIHEIKEQLGIRGKAVPKISTSFYAEIMNAISFFQYADESAIMEMVEDYMRRPINSRLQNVQKSVNLEDMTTAFPSELGLPIIHSINMPLMASIQGDIRMMTEPAESSIIPSKIEIHAERFQPKFVFNRMPMVQFISPFTLKLFGAGVDKAVSVSFPMDGTFQINTRNMSAMIEASAITESQQQQEMITVVTYPYTSAAKLSDFIPFSKEPSSKIVHTRQPKTQEYTFGQTLGLKMKFIQKTDYQFTDFASYYNMIMEKNSPVSIINFLSAPSSLKYHVTKISLNPSESETQKFTAYFSIKKPVYSEQQTEPMDDSQESSFEYEISEDPYDSYESQVSDLQRQMEWLEPKFVHQAIHQLSKRKYHRLAVGSDDVDAYGTTVSVSFTGRSSRHLYADAWYKVSTTGQEEQMKVNYRWVNPSSGQFSTCIDAKMTKPVLPLARHALLQSEIAGKFSFKADWGHSCNSEKSISVEGDYERSHEAKQWAQESPEAQSCVKYESRGYENSPICKKAKIQAAVVDIIDAKFTCHNIPPIFMNMTLHLDTAMKYLLYPYLSNNPVEVSNPRDEVSTYFRFKPEKYTFDVFVKKPRENSMYMDVRLPAVLADTVNVPNMYEDLSHKFKKIFVGEDKTQCVVDKEHVKTFDNVTVATHLPSCYVLLTKDCVGTPDNKDLAILAKQVHGYKYAEILFENHRIEITSRSENRMVVLVDNRQISAAVGHPYYVKSSNGRRYATVRRISDSQIEVSLDYYISKMTMSPHTIWLDMSQGMFKDKLCGICGDMNGEKTADLTDPHGCIQRSAAKYIQSWTTGNCRSPSLREEECVRKPSLYQ